MTPSTAQVAAALRRAADLIEEHGWTQGDYFRTRDGEPFEGLDEWEFGCSMCALGALRVADARDDEDRFEEAVAALTRGLEATPGIELFEGAEIACWNDEPGRTAEEVVAQMRATADRLDKETAT